MNEKQQIFEIIDGFKNLTSKIKKDNDEIKDSLKNKELTITACKKEYRKLFEEHEELKHRYIKLEKYCQEKRNIPNENRQNRKRKKQLQKKNKRILLMMMMMMIIQLMMKMIVIEMKIKTTMMMMMMTMNFKL